MPSLDLELWQTRCCLWFVLGGGPDEIVSEKKKTNFNEASDSEVQQRKQLCKSGKRPFHERVDE